jgi:anti-sigma factor RsiW
MQHQDHDLSLVAGLAAGDLSTQDRARAQQILESCAECTTIHADLIAIAAATRTLPKHLRAPRDYRLSADQAGRLSRRSWLRTLLAPFAGTHSAARPMAAAFTTLGLAGLLVVTVLPGLFGSAAMLAPERQSTTGAAAAAPTAAPARPAAAPGASSAPAPNGPGAAIDNNAATPPLDAEFGAKGGSVGSDAPRAQGEGSDGSGALTSMVAPSPLLLGSLALLGLGLALFGLRYAGRRLR